MKAIVLAAILALSSAAAELPREAGPVGITLPDGNKVNLADFAARWFASPSS